jgi:hypothetical protein
LMAGRGATVQNVSIDARGADIGTVTKMTLLVQKLALQQYTAAMVDRQQRSA